MKETEEFTEKFQAIFCIKAPRGDGVLDPGKMRKLVNPAPTLSLCEEP
jgi:hypothetical protein